VRPQGGGNCGNALTAAARLGLSPTIVTKIGGDGVGDGILAEFQRDGVDTSCVLRAPGAPSPFTYIIVDRQGGWLGWPDMQGARPGVGGRRPKRGAPTP
jgi:sugar/nucleoside kinase (ribokinase family)